jgi:hypothetical protein
LIASDGAGCVPGESLELQNKGDYVEFILIIRLHIWVSQSLNFFHVWVSWRFGVFLIWFNTSLTLGTSLEVDRKVSVVVGLRGLLLWRLLKKRSNLLIGWWRTLERRSGILIDLGRGRKLRAFCRALITGGRKWGRIEIVAGVLQWTLIAAQDIPALW